jgi:glucokinase
MPIYIGLDIGGTKTMAAAANEEGAILRRVRADTPASWDDGQAMLKQMVEDLRGRDTILGFGAAVGGPLDYMTGIISPLHQPQWRNVPLKAVFETEYGCPFSVDIDTNAAALAEWAASGKTTGSLLYLTLSTGMGGGLIIDGQIFRGSGGAHPEVGHQSVAFHCAHPERVICDCGTKDCLEALVSGSGIRRVYGKPAEALSEAEWSEVGYNLGQGLRNMAANIAPERIVLGGGVAVGGGEALLNKARQVMEERLLVIASPPVSLSYLGYDTALHGAIALARYGNR